MTERNDESARTMQVPLVHRHLSRCLFFCVLSVNKTMTSRSSPPQSVGRTAQSCVARETARSRGSRQLSRDARSVDVCACASTTPAAAAVGKPWSSMSRWRWRATPGGRFGGRAGGRWSAENVDVDVRIVSSSAGGDNTHQRRLATNPPAFMHP